jgi:hypothetical protein
VKGDKKGLSDETPLAAAGVTDGGELVVKDLGPQISWTTVFVIEYVCGTLCYGDDTLLIGFDAFRLVL